MTDDKIALCALLEKGSDTTFLREMIGFAAERLMTLETESLCNAAPGERSTDRQNQRNGYRDRDWQTRAARSNCASPNCATAATSLASWSRAGWPRRR
jgi:transposase-like protein